MIRNLKNDEAPLSSLNSPARLFRDLRRSAFDTLRGLFFLLPIPLRREIRRFALILLPKAERRQRRKIARRYLSGSGIEIGALHLPLRVPRGVRVQYVDRLSTPELRRQYPELADWPLVAVDILDDGERLSALPGASVDFVVASHMIEHAQDPITTLGNWLRVIRPSGVLFLAVPHKDHTFDRDRPVTPLDHVVRDHTEGPEWSRRAHFEEWSTLVEHVPQEQVASRVQELMKIDYSIHFHVWTEIEFLELLLYCRKLLAMPLDIELFQHNGDEFIAVLRKCLDEEATSQADCQ